MQIGNSVKLDVNSDNSLEHTSNKSIWGILSEGLPSRTLSPYKFLAALTDPVLLL
jgi:hypothetical protein